MVRTLNNEHLIIVFLFAYLMHIRKITTPSWFHPLVHRPRRVRTIAVINLAKTTRLP